MQRPIRANSERLAENCAGPSCGGENARWTKLHLATSGSVTPPTAEMRTRFRWALVNEPDLNPVQDLEATPISLLLIRSRRNVEEQVVLVTKFTFHK